MDEQPASLRKYQYRCLNKATHEIRLVRILPGNFGDPIRIIIVHVPLSPVPRKQHLDENKLTRVQGTLPPGWSVSQTLEDSLLFHAPDGTKTWDHPDVGVNSETWGSATTKHSEETPEYEALSYVWGSPQNPRLVIIEQEEQTSELQHAQIQLPVTQNLHEAIQYLRFTDKFRTIWIDAICINQDDIKERNEQVVRMTEIYSQARAVVAFLGPQSQECDRAFAALEKLGTQIVSTRDQRRYARPGCTEPTWVSETGPVPVSSDELKCIDIVGERPWFRRIWVLQEIQLASSRSVLQSGLRKISWPVFRSAVNCLYEKWELQAPSRPNWHLLLWTSLDHFTQPFENVMETLSRSRRCTDKRDLVYGLLSLAPAAVTARIKVDYGLPVVEVFKSLFIAFSQAQNRVNMLLWCGRLNLFASEDAASWPTWVPNWGMHCQPPVGPTAGYFAAGFSPVEGSKGENEDCLKLKGLFVGDVIAVPPVGLSLGSVADIFSWLRNYNGVLEQKYPSEEQRDRRIGALDNLIRMISQGRLRSRFPHLSYYPTLQEWRDAIFAETPKHSTAEAAPISPFAPNYMCLLDIYAINRQKFLFQTKDRVGIGSVPAQVGDRIFLPLGCASPILARKRPNEDAYEVVGSVYLEGVMDGEALLGKLPPPWEVQVHHRQPGRYNSMYVNTETGEVRFEDPRLQDIAVPAGWEPASWLWTTSDPQACCRFRNKETGEVINYDPRMSGEALKGRGYDIETITFV